MNVESPRRGVRLGLDLGEVRVGVARSDPDGLMAVPVETLPGADEAPLAARIGELVDEYGAIVVVIGLPRHLNGSEGAASARVRRYAAAIARRVAPVEVRLVDERMTTVTANRSLREAGKNGRSSRQVVDQVAATVILQSALDTEKASRRPAGVLVTVETAPGESVR